MRDRDKTKEQLICELEELRRRVAVLEGVEVERARAESALRESEERFRKAFEEGPMGVALLDLDARIQHVNHRFCDMLGHTEEEIIARGIHGITHPDDYEADHQMGMRLLQGDIPTYTIEKRFVRKDGQAMWGHLTTSMMHDAEGKPTHIIGMIEDITQRKRAEQSLRESLQRFRSLFQDASVGTVLVTPSGEFVQANRAFCQFLGYPEEELAGKSVLAFTHPDDRQSSAMAIDQAAHSGSRLQRLRKRYLHRSGRVVWGEVTSTLICDVAGNPSYFVTQVMDITEQKQAEEALRQANEELERRVAERTAELQQANEQLQREVQERKQAEEALRASEERYRAVVEDQTEVICRFKADGTFIFVNDVWCRFFGKTTQQLVGRKWHPEPLPEDVPLIQRQLASLSPANPVVTIENRVYSGLGELRWMQFVNRGFFDEEGRLTEIQSVGRDITDRRRAEEALQQSERRFRNYFEQGLIGMAVTSSDTRWLEVNDRLCEFLGYSRDELFQTRDWAACTHPDDLEPNLQLRARLLAGEIQNYTLDKKYVRKDGGIVYGTLYVRAVRKEDGSIDHIIALVQDITEQKKAQEALQQSHAQLQTIYDEMIEGLLITDIETKRFVRVNSSMCRMLGYPEEELLAAAIKDIHPPEEVPDDLQRFQTVAEGRRTINEDRPVLRKDGSIFYADITGRPILYQGRPCVLALFRDVTERKRAQEALERERQSLWHMLQASDHERQTISYEIHDGLAQYLAAANMHLQMFDHLRDGNCEEAKKAYDAAVQLVRQSHAESRRLISGVRPPVLDEAGLETAVAHLVHDQRMFKGPKIKLDSDVEFSRLPSILENSLYRIAQEALTNACKHSKSENVVVTLAQEGQEVRLEVQDWGIGFDPESVQKGHFGLESIRQRVRLLGGRLAVESKAGAGTLIQVVVPIVEGPENRSQTAAGQAPPPR